MKMVLHEKSQEKVKNREMIAQSLHCGALKHPATHILLQDTGTFYSFVKIVKPIMKCKLYIQTKIRTSLTTIPVKRIVHPSSFCSTAKKTLQKDKMKMESIKNSILPYTHTHTLSPPPPHTHLQSTNLHISLKKNIRKHAKIFFLTKDNEK